MGKTHLVIRGYDFCIVVLFVFRLARRIAFKMEDWGKQERFRGGIGQE